MRIAFLGAGAVAKSLSHLCLAASHDTRLSSRGGADGTTTFADCAAWGEVIVVAVPYSAAAGVLASVAAHLTGKIVIDATNPLREDWGPLLLGQENSAGEEIARAAPGARVVKAFNTVFADIMRPDRLDRGGRRATAFLASDDADAAGIVARLAGELGFAPVMAGPLRCARYLEAMAHLNIAIAVGQGGGTNAAFLYDQSK